jgi:hypothetical protein
MANGMAPGDEPITLNSTCCVSIFRTSSRVDVNNKKLCAITTFCSKYDNIIKKTGTEIYHALENYHWSYYNMTTCNNPTKYNAVYFMTYVDGSLKLEPLFDKYEWYIVPVFDISREDTENDTYGLIEALKFITSISSKNDCKLLSYVDTIINKKEQMPPIVCFKKTFTSSRKNSFQKRIKTMLWRTSINVINKKKYVKMLVDMGV